MWPDLAPRFPTQIWPQWQNLMRGARLLLVVEDVDAVLRLHVHQEVERVLEAVRAGAAQQGDPARRPGGGFRGGARARGGGGGVPHARRRPALAREAQLAVVPLVRDDVGHVGEHLLAVAADQDVGKVWK